MAALLNLPGILLLLLWLALTANDLNQLRWPVVELNCVHSARDAADANLPSGTVQFQRPQDRSVFNTTSLPSELYVPGDVYHLRQSPSDPSRLSATLSFSDALLSRCLLVFLGVALLLGGRWLKNIVAAPMPYSVDFEAATTKKRAPAPKPESRAGTSPQPADASDLLT